MGGGSPSTSTTIQKTELPQWVNDAGKSNYDKAVAIGNKPLVQFSGSTAAPMSQTMQDAIAYLKGNYTAGSGDTNAASGIFAKMADPSAMAGGIQSYMNPYIDNVETKALGALEDSRIKALMGNSDQAIKSRAFGGDRSAIVDAITNSEAAKEAGILSAGLRKEGFDTASANQRADLTTAGQGLLATGDQKNAQMLKSFASLAQAGSAEQTQAQNEINSDVAKFNEVRNKDIDALNLRLSALGMTPYNTSSSSTTTGTSETKGLDPATMIMGLLSMGLGLSEDDTKTDKVKVGKVPGMDLDMWSYRYKGDPKTYPKVVGVMASEVEEKYPEHVAKLGGVRTLSPGIMSSVMGAVDGR